MGISMELLYEIIDDFIGGDASVATEGMTVQIRRGVFSKLMRFFNSYTVFDQRIPGNYYLHYMYAFSLGI